MCSPEEGTMFLHNYIYRESAFDSNVHFWERRLTLATGNGKLASNLLYCAGPL